MMIADDSYSGSVVSISNTSYRDAVFTIVVYPELYRHTVFTININPDLFLDTVSLVVSSRVPAFFCFCGCTRVSPCLFWSFEAIWSTRLGTWRDQIGISRLFSVEL